jgi:hypothetical protein
MAIPATLEEQIERIENLEISYRNLHTKATIEYNNGDSIVIPYSSLISKYRYFLDSIIVGANFDDESAREYLYNPRMLSFDIYGTVELWAELLRINNCSSCIQFKPEKNVKIYDPSSFKEFINEILILENVIE